MVVMAEKVDENSAAAFRTQPMVQVSGRCRNVPGTGIYCVGFKVWKLVIKPRCP